MDKEIKEKIYQAMDSFLVETENIKGKPILRSLERLNQDRHLFVKRIEEIINTKQTRLRYTSRLFL